MGDRKYLLKKDKHDERDFLFCNLIEGGQPQPIDLRNKFIPPFNQFSQGSCTSNAGTADKMYMEGNKTLLSRQFLYNQERIVEGTFPEDSGAQMRTICKTLQQYGICEESFLPYGENNIGVTPSKEAYENAKLHTVSSYHRVTSIDEMKQALSQGHCILLGIKVYSSFENVQDNGEIPYPNIKTEELMGGHATLLVGWENIPNTCKIQNIVDTVLRRKVPTTKFILRNSWSDKSTSDGGWGDKGYGYIDDVTLMTILSDAWVIIK